MKSNAKRRKPAILVSNDDGIDAPGIEALVLELKKIGDVTVVAPQTQQSAVGHAITMNYPLRVRQFQKHGDFFGFAVDGTPADAVKLAVRALLKRRPDILVSGINHGSNTAISVLYSGTVSAATEGTILGIPSIAVSLTTFGPADFSFAARFSARLVRKVLGHGLPKGTLLNVNVPPVGEKKIKGVRITRQGESVWDDMFDARRDPANKGYYWLTGDLVEADDGDDADQWAVSHRYVSVTPLQYDLTDYAMMDVMKDWSIDELHRSTRRKRRSKGQRK